MHHPSSLLQIDALRDYFAANFAERSNHIDTIVDERDRHRQQRLLRGELSAAADSILGAKHRGGRVLKEVEAKHMITLVLTVRGLPSLQLLATYLSVFLLAAVASECRR